MGSLGSKLPSMVSNICPCRYCSKYVCNAMKCHSKCSDCCDVEVETTEVKDTHEEEFECNNCFYLKKS